MKRLIPLLMLMVLIAGCPGDGNKADVRPESRTDAPVDVPVTANDIGTLEQNIMQKLTTIMTTINTQTTNYQRDKTDAKTERRIFACLIAVVAFGGLLGWCSPRCLSGTVRLVALAWSAGLVGMTVFMLTL